MKPGQPNGRAKRDPPGAKSCGDPASTGRWLRSAHASRHGSGLRLAFPPRARWPLLRSDRRHEPCPDRRSPTRHRCQHPRTFHPASRTPRRHARVRCDRVELCASPRGTPRGAHRLRMPGRRRPPVVLVAGGISAGRHVAAHDGVPERVAGGRRRSAPDCALDPARYRMLAIDWLGSDGRSTPDRSGRPGDCDRCVLDALGIQTLAAFVGCSYGAMVGLQFAAAPRRALRRLVAISGADRAHPYASAWRALQRRAVALGALQCDEAPGSRWRVNWRCSAIARRRNSRERFDAPALVAQGRVRCACRGLPGRLWAAVRCALLADGVPAPVRIDRPAAMDRRRAVARADDTGRRSREIGWCRSRSLSAGRRLRAPRPPARVAFALRPRRLPEGGTRRSRAVLREAMDDAHGEAA